MKSVCITDIGSNTIKAYIYDENFNVVASKTLHSQLIKYIIDGILTSEGIDVLCDAISELNTFALSENVIQTYRIATAALRSAMNLDEIEKSLNNRGIEKIDIISAEDEAFCDYLSAKYFSVNQSGVCLDLGGGSGQIVVYDQNGLIKKKSYPIGSLKLKLQYVEDIIPSRCEYERISENIKAMIFNDFASYRSCINLTVMGGSALCIASMLIQNEHIPSNGVCIDVTQIKQLSDKLLSDKQQAINYLTEKASERMHSVMCAMAVIEAVASYFSINHIYVLPRGVREGYLLKRGVFNEGL